jgi:hypothetical protein
MESGEVGKKVSVVRMKVFKPYVAPRLQRLSPALAKSRLSRDADTSDSELQQLIESVDHLHGAKGS